MTKRTFNEKMLNNSYRFLPIIVQFILIADKTTKYNILFHCRLKSKCIINIFGS